MILQKENEFVLLAAISKLIIDVVGYVNVQRNMNQEQIATSARFIAQTYFYMNLSEIKKCFDRGCQGKYGQLYERMDGTILTDWLQKFDLERMNEIRKKADQESERNNIYEVFQHPEMKKVLEEVTDKMKLRTEVEREPYVPPAKHPMLIQIEQEWDGLLTETRRGHKAASVECVKYKKKDVDFVEFYNIRFEEIRQTIPEVGDDLDCHTCTVMNGSGKSTTTIGVGYEIVSTREGYVTIIDDEKYEHDFEVETFDKWFTLKKKNH